MNTPESLIDRLSNAKRKMATETDREHFRANGWNDALDFAINLIKHQEANNSPFSDEYGRRCYIDGNEDCSEISVRRPPKLLVKAVIDKIDGLGKMRPEELLEQDEIGFLELMDMAYTLRDEVLSKPEPVSVDLEAGANAIRSYSGLDIYACRSYAREAAEAWGIKCK